MSKLFKLIKIDLIQSYSLNKLNKKHGKKRGLGALIATTLLGALILGLVCYLFYFMSTICAETGQEDYLLVFGYSVGTIICITITISKANGMLFEAKDFELLMSMPIKPKHIVLSKLLSLLILNYFGFGLLFVPAFVFYGIYTSANVLYYLFALIAFLVGPLLIVTVFSFLSYFLGLALKKVKAKSIIISLLSLAFFIVFMGFYMTFTTKMGAIEGSGDINTMIDLYGEMFGNLKNNFIKFYPISGWLLDGLNGDILKYLLYIGVMVIPFAVLVLFVGKNFLKANMNAKISYSAKDFKIQEQKQSGKIKAILKRDVKRFFSSSVQVLNIGIGPILSTIILVVMVINTKSAMESEGVAKDFIKSFMPVISILTVGFTFGIMPSTSSSISLEGKNFWILKSAPIETKDVFIAKISFYVILCFPFIIINTIIMALMFELVWYNILMVFVIQILLVLIYSVEGLWINILTPKFDWDNEVKAVKQGTGPLLAMLFGLLLGAIIYVPPFFFLSSGVSPLLIIMLESIVVLVAMTVVLFTHGKKRYEAIEI